MRDEKQIVFVLFIDRMKEIIDMCVLYEMIHRS